MNIVIDPNDLRVGLGVIGPTLSGRTTTNLLQCAHLATGPNSLIAASYTSGMQTAVWLPAVIKDSGEAAVPGRRLMEYIGAISKDCHYAKVGVAKKKMRVAATGTSAEFPADDILPWMDVDAFAPLAITTAETLSALIERVIYAAAQTDARPILESVRLIGDRSTLEATATDGYMLAIHRIDFPADESFEIIVPRQACLALDKILRGLSAETFVRIFLRGDQTVLFVVETPGSSLIRIEFSASLLDGKYWDVRGIIPKSSEMRVVFNVNEMIAALKAIRLFSRDNSNIVRTKWDPGIHSQVSLVGESEEMGNASVTLSASFLTMHSQPFEISFDTQLLLTLLSSVNSPSVTIEFTRPTRPGVVIPSGYTSEQYINLIMPMHPPRGQTTERPR